MSQSSQSDLFDDLVNGFMGSSEFTTLEDFICDKLGKAEGRKFLEAHHSRVPDIGTDQKASCGFAYIRKGRRRELIVENQLPRSSTCSFFICQTDSGSDGEVEFVKQLDNLEMLDIFKAECDALRLAQRIDGVPSLSGFGTKGGKPFIAMEHIEGETLESWEFDSTSENSLRAALKLFSELTGIVRATHEYGIIHRDIKPANVIVQSETHKVYLVDFGICADEYSQIPPVRAYTREYASPEQLRGHVPRQNHDVYLLGATLVRTLTGFAPGAEDQCGLQRLSDLGLPRCLITVCKNACHPNPDQRYETAKELQLELQRVLDSLKPHFTLTKQLLILSTSIAVLGLVAWALLDQRQEKEHNPVFHALIDKPSADAPSSESRDKRGAEDLSTINWNRSFDDHIGQVWRTAVSSDGRTVATGDDGGFVRLFNLQPDKTAGFLDEPMAIKLFRGHVWGLCFSPTSDWIVATGEHDDAALVVKMSLDGKIAWQKTFASSPKSVAISSDLIIAVASGNGVSVFSESGNKIAELEGMECVQFHPLKSELWTVSMRQDKLWEVLIYDENFEVTNRLPTEYSQIYDLDVGYDGATAASFYNGNVMYWKTPQNEPWSFSTGETGSAWSVKITPDGEKVFAGNSRGEIIVAETDSYPNARLFSSPHLGFVRDLNIHNSYLMSAASDGKLVVSKIAD